MHVGQRYRFFEFLYWTRREIYVLVLLSVLPVILYQIVGLRWLAIPWTAVALLGTATAFVVGFKNVQTYNRAWEARQIWGEIVSGSRSWAAMSVDYVSDPERTKELVYRHFAWLTAMRYQMRESRAWESVGQSNNAEYRNYYCIPESESSLESELAKYISGDELRKVLASRNKAAQLMRLQSRTIKGLFIRQEIVVLQFVDMQRAVKDFFMQQGRSERIKDFPYPRQYATVSSLFVRLFCLLLPIGFLKDFDGLNEGVEGVMQGNMIWFVVPFSVMISWMYTSLEQVGESTAFPFEGGANDVPISQLCRVAEVDMREMLGETSLPPSLQPKNNIVL